jgi:hypothetical protein
MATRNKANTKTRDAAIQAVGDACSVMTHFVSIVALDPSMSPAFRVSPDNLLDISLQEIGITDTYSFQQILKEYTPARMRGAVDKLTLTPDMRIGAVVDALTSEK